MFLELIQSLRAAELTAKDGRPFVFPRSLIKVMVVSEEGSDLLVVLRDTVKVSAFCLRCSLNRSTFGT